MTVLAQDYKKAWQDYRVSHIEMYVSVPWVVEAKAKLLLLKLIQIFERAVLVMKKLEIEETKTT